MRPLRLASFRHIRFWSYAASPMQRTLTAAAVAVVVALVGWALMPAPSEPSRELLDASGERLITEAPGISSSGGPQGPGTAGPESSSVSETGAPQPVGGGGSTTRESAPSSGTSPGASDAPSARLTATDRGVSAEAIKVGFVVINFGPASERGFGAAGTFRKDTSRVIDALVDHANKNGGVLGRRIEPVKVSVDPVGDEDMRKKCLELTQTEAVFAVMDTFGFSKESATACVTAEQKTLLVNGNPGSSQHVRQSFPYAVSLQKDDNRKVKDLAYAAKASGFFDPAKGFKKLGIFGDNCSPYVFDSPTEGLKAHLAAVGVKGWTEFRVDCSLESFQRGAAEAVLHFNQAGVSHVLLAGRPPSVEPYLLAAHRARYYPEYFAGDYLNLAIGGLTKNYEPEGFDGALGVTATHAGEGVMGKPLPPLVQTCSKILTDHGLPPISFAPPDDMGDDLEALTLCESFVLFLQVAKAAGPNLTRSTWAGALAGVGDFRAGTVDLARFDRRGKMTGGDTMKLIKWHRDCSCWRQISEFGPAVG